MNQTNGGSDRAEVLADILSNNPKNKNSEFEIVNGEDVSGRVEIGIEPGMRIVAGDGINVDSEKEKQILENQKNRKTEKQVKKQKQR